MTNQVAHRVLVFLQATLLSIGLLGCSKPRETASCNTSAAGTLIWIPAASFIQGEEPQYDEEGPPTTVRVKGFWISATETTNAQFAEFVEATGYITLAERPFTSPDGAVAAPPGSALFSVPTSAGENWWKFVPGANWRHPAGPDSDLSGKMDLPVVHVSYDDALAFAQWKGLALPTEAQWELAARSRTSKVGEPRDGSGKPIANFYQGVFPLKDTGEDGFTGKAPVGCFAANSLGVYDMIGNVWEWTSQISSRPEFQEETRVIKGGSFLCAANYCARYRPAARQFQERGLGTDHIGIRLVDNRRPPPAARRRTVAVGANSQ